MSVTSTLSAAAQEVRDDLDPFYDRFPPPLLHQIDQVVTKIREREPEDLGALLDAAAAEMPTAVYGDHITALVAALRSELDPARWPWEETLREIERRWPEWGTPWLLASRYALSGGGIRPDATTGVLELLLRAERFVPVADPGVLHVADRLRKCAEDYLKALPRHRAAYETRDARTMIGVRIAAAGMLARHRPTVRNYSRLLDYLSLAGDFDGAAAAVERFFTIHGRDPRNWDVSEKYDQLSCAGSICQVVNIVHAKGRSDEHDFVSWNEAAIDFFKRSLASETGREGTSSERAYAVIHLAETYAQVLRRSDSRLDDGKYREMLHDAVRTIEGMKLFFSTREAMAERNLTMIYTGAARRARRGQDPPEEIEHWVARAVDSFKAQIAIERPGKHPTLYRLLAEFLLEFEKYAEAAEIAPLADEHEVLAAMCMFRGQRRKEAVKHLIECLGGETSRETTGFGNLLVQYLTETEEKARIPDKLRDRAIETLRPLLGWFVRAASVAIEHGEIVKAKRSLDVVRYVEKGPPDPKVAHLSARIGVAEIDEGRAPESVLEEFNDVFRSAPGLRRDDYLRGVYLEILGRAPHLRSLDPDEVWATATASPVLNPIDIYYALRWQALSLGGGGRWWVRLLHAGRAFPDNAALKRLPALLWRTFRSDAIPTIFALRNEQLFESDTRWISDVFDDFRGDFFMQPETIANMVAWAEESPGLGQALERCLIQGFSRAQMAAGRDRVRQMTYIRTAARCIAALPARMGQSTRWADWLGGERGVLVTFAMSYAARAVETLYTALVAGRESDRERWTQALEEVIRPFEEVAKEKGEEFRRLVEFCVRSTEQFDPARPSPSYWNTLRGLVAAFTKTVPPEALPQAMIDLWNAMYAGVGKALLKKVIDPAASRLHAFKGELMKRKGEVTAAEIDHFTAIIDHIRTFIRWNRAAELRPVDINAIVREGVFRPPLARRSKGSWFPLVYVSTTAEPVEVIGDPELLAQAVFALAENAHKHSGNESDADWIWCSVKREADAVTFEVRDNGAGATPAVVARLNDAEIAGYSASGSTGYGTRLCHRVAALHRGTLRFESAGRGTGMTARLRIPLGGNDAHAANPHRR